MGEWLGATADRRVHPVPDRQPLRLGGCHPRVPTRFDGFRRSHSAGLVPALASVTVAFGTLMIIASTLLYLRPALHMIWGVIVLVLAIASTTGIFVGAAGLGVGVVGIAFGIIGGMFAISWRPGAGMPGFTSAGAPYRLCGHCGRSISISFAHCPFCGTPAMTATPPARDEPSASQRR